MVILIVAFLAVEFVADVTPAAFFGNDPLARSPRWIVTRVLRVAAVELGHPMRLIVLMKRGYAADQRGADPFLKVSVMSAMEEFGRVSVRALAF